MDNYSAPEDVELYLQYYDLKRDPAEKDLLPVPLFSLVTLCALKQAGLTKETTSSKHFTQPSSGKGNLTIKLIPIHPIHEENHVDLAAEPKPDQEFLQKPNEYFINLENVRQLFHDCVLLKKAQSFELEPQVAACVFPAVFVPQQNLCITGLCSLLRYIIRKFCPEIHHTLLGHQYNCLSAPAEVSTWTKFCEIDLPRAIEREKQATAEGSGDVESSNEIPYELAQFEIHLRQPVKIHNIRKRMQQEQKASSSSENETNGRKVSVDKNGLEVDPILAFARTQHFYAEGPDFLLSDLILYPLYSLIMHQFTKENMMNLLPKTMLWYDRVSSLYKKSCEEIIGQKLSLDGLRIQVITRIWPKNDVPDQSLYKNDKNRINPASRLFTKQPDIDRAMSLVKEAKIEVLQAMPFDYTSSKIDWNALPELVHPLGGQLPPERLDKKCQQLENLTAAVKAMARPGQVIVDFCSGGGHLAIVLAYLLPEAIVYLVENKQESLMRAVHRVQSLGLSNCRFYQGNMDYFKGRFDIGVSLHACGVATDLVIQACIRNGASFVSCPCCYGSLQKCHMLSYPRSNHFAPIDFKDYLVLGHTADQWHGSSNGGKCQEKEAQGRFAMNIIDTDRATMALETGRYSRVELCQLFPPSCTPKNNLIIGYRKE